MSQAYRPTAALVRRPTLIEASAGTGKTHAIVSLVLRLVAEEGVELPRILVVTFTRAATAELRERIRTRLGDAAEAVEGALAGVHDPGADVDEVIVHLVEVGRDRGELGEMLRRLTVARERFDDATISTIHGFCNQTLHQSAFETQTEFDAELVEDTADLVREVTTDLVIRDRRDADRAWVDYLSAQRVDSRDLEQVAGLVEREPHLRLLPDVPDDLEPTAVWTAAVREFRARWQEHADDGARWLDASWRELFGSATRTYRPVDVEGYRAAIDAWCDGEIPPLGQLGPAGDALRRLSPAAMRDKLKVDAALDHPMLLAVEEVLAAPSLPAAAERVRFARRVLAELEVRKARRNALSFNDLLHRLARRLEDENTRETLRAAIVDRFDAALIDEFQDTDPIQWTIFDAAFGDGSWMFLVGDPKQAIYAFRGADVHTYLSARERLGEPFGLDRSWRSDPRFVTAMNHLFDDDVFGHELIRYRAVAAERDDRLRVGEQQPAALRLAFVSRGSVGVEGGKAIPKERGRRHVARTVADEIATFLGSGAEILGDEGWCAVQPRDVAVLVRRHREARLVQVALAEARVPAVVASAGSVLDSPEAAELQRVLDGMLRPGSATETRAALATTILGVDGAGLAAFDEDETAWNAAVTLLAAGSRTWREHGIAAAMRELFAEGDVLARLVAHDGGERTVTNLLHLLELLHDAEAARRLGPAALAGWLRDRRAGADGGDVSPDELELRLESDADAVRIVTVHASKGLEYPVVWAPMLWDGRLLSNRDRRTLRFHDPEEDGALSLDLHVDHRLPPKAGRLAIAERERWEEDIRLLYVALTRARHRAVVHWGAFNGSGSSPLGRALYGWELGEVTTPRDDDPNLRGRLEEIAAGSGGTIEVVDVDARTSPRHVTPEAPVGDELRVRPFRRPPLDRRWQRTSFSRMTRPVDARLAPESPELDEGHDRDAGTGSGSTPAAAIGGEPVPLGDLRRGAEIGTFLHGVLEDLDFTQAGDDRVLGEVLDRRLKRHGVEQIDRDSLLAGIRAVVTTPLGPLVGDTRLADVPKGARLNELDFDLPLAGGYAPHSAEAAVTRRRLADVLAAHADASTAPLTAYAERLRDPRLPSAARGFLTGSIDLVLRVEVDGEPRYAVVDHKSNWLGDRHPDGDRSLSGHYRPDLLADEMVHHHYVLQYHLYLVALHRYLRWRLGSAYDYDRDVAGVLYLFLRGMIGPQTPRDASGQTYGVYADRPPRALVEDLDAALREGVW